MYSHGIATIALNEAYGMTKDRNMLLRPAQAATNFICAKQGSDGTVFYAHVDITELKRQQRLLAQAERSARDSEAQLREKSILLEATLEHMDQGVAKISATGVVELCNRRAMELLDLPAELMASKPTLVNVLAYLRARGEFQGASQEVQDLLRHSNGGVDQPQVYDRPRPDGRILEVQTVPIKGGGALRTFTDVTQRKQAEQQIRHVAEHDGLTGLLNRTAFLQALQAAATDVHRSGRGFAVLYVDLDGFKPVNDRYGHAVGDQLLVWVARQLTQAAREDDVVARLGGDEFALLQRGVSDGDSAYRLADRLVQALGQPTEIEAHALQIGASIGIVLSPGDGTEVVMMRDPHGTSPDNPKMPGYVDDKGTVEVPLADFNANFRRLRQNEPTP